MKMRKTIILLLILMLAGAASAAIVETWGTWVDNEAIPFSTVGSNQGWEVKSSAPSTNPYTGDDSGTMGDASFYALDGMALRTASGNDYEIRHTSAGVDFGMTAAEIATAGGITAGFNHRMAWTGGGSGWRSMMALREGAVANSPSFGYEWDSATGTTRWTLRTIDNVKIFGNTLTGSKASLDAFGIRESWLSVSMVYDGDNATLLAEHVFPSETIGSAIIDTGLANVFVGSMFNSELAALNRMQIRTGGTSKIWLDNLSVDVVPEPATLALLSLGGLLLRRRK